MELTRRTWIAAIKLAAVISTVAALVAIAVSSLGEVQPLAIIVPVIIVAFVSSWIQTGRVARSRSTTAVLIPARSARRPSLHSAAH